MRIPCEHIFAAVVCSSNNEDYIKNFPKNYHPRWNTSDDIDFDTALVQFVRKVKLEKLEESDGEAEESSSELEENFHGEVEGNKFLFSF